MLLDLVIEVKFESNELGWAHNHGRMSVYSLRSSPSSSMARELVEGEMTATASGGLVTASWLAWLCCLGGVLDGGGNKLVTLHRALLCYFALSPISH